MFVVFACGFVGASIYGFTSGNPYKFFSGLDGDGNFCGYSDGYTDYPYLYFADLTASNIWNYAVCVSSCPDGNSTISCHTTTYVTDCNAYEQYDTYNFADEYCIPSYDDLPEDLKSYYISSGLESYLNSASQYISDMINAWSAYLIALVTCFILLFLYSVFIRYCAAILAWLSYILVFFAIAGLGCYSYFYAISYYEDGDSTQNMLKITAYVLWGLSVLYVLLICCLYKDVRKSIAIIQAAAAFMQTNMHVILVPIYSIVFTVCFLAYYLIGQVYLFCVGTITPVLLEDGTYTRTIEWTDLTEYLNYFFFFGFLWVLALVLACNFFVIASCVCHWYFTSSSDTRGNISITQGIWWAVRYHLGSLAFGSFILAVVWLIRIIFEYVAAQLKKAEGNNPAGMFIKCMVCCCRCCLSCVNRFIKFLSENAYVQILLTNENFCPAALNAFLLILKNAATFALTEAAGTIIITLGKILISVLNTLLIFFILTNLSYLVDQINSPFAPAIVAFLISFTFVSVFLSIFDVAQTAIM